MKKSIIFIISLMLAGTAFSAQDDKIYTMNDFKELKKELKKAGRLDEMWVPCPCFWNKKRGRGDDFLYVDEGKFWECKVWNKDDTCYGIGILK